MDQTKTISKMKTKILLFLMSGCSILMPIKPLIMIVVGMVFLDTIMGVWATIKVEGKKSFRSGKLFNIVPKVFLYSITILLSFLMDKYIFEGVLFSIPFFLSKASSILWIYIETKSIDENSQKMGNKPILTIIKELLGGIKDFKKDINETKK
jgi:hypothetical protein